MPAPAPRDHLLRALRADLIGPYHLDEAPIAAEEILELAPSHHYLTGFLAPEEEREPDAPDADDPLGAGSDEPEEETQGEEPENKRKNLWPASIGLSVLVPKETREVQATVRFAEYYLEVEKAEGRGRSKRLWKRRPRQALPCAVPLDAKALHDGISLGSGSRLTLFGQVRAVEHVRGLDDGTQALALFVVNQRGPGTQGRRDEQLVFQVEMEITCAEGIVPRPDFSDEESAEWDDKVADLQFRGRVEHAVGHGVAVEVPPGQSPVTRVKTTWLPEHEVPRIVARSEAGVTVAMEELAHLEKPEDVRAHLDRLPAAYGEWIARQQANATVGGGKRAHTRDALMAKAETAKTRITEGIALLATNPEVRRAFCLANQAMADAALHRSPSRYQDGKRPEWYLFQLAFVLMNLHGLADGDHADRERVELIFFPTGGGKTEAYLGVIACCLLLRRLRRAKLADGGLGVAVLLRYTLRLLTLDQLGRAATMTCALESLRRKMPAVLGDARFSVGLWVGRSATANTMDEAAKLVTDYKTGVNAQPLPAAHVPVVRQGSRPEQPHAPADSRTAPDEVAGRLHRARRASSPAPTTTRGSPSSSSTSRSTASCPASSSPPSTSSRCMPWRGEAGMLFGKVAAREGRCFYGPMDGSRRAGRRTLPGGFMPARAHHPGRAAPHLRPARHDGRPLRDGHRRACSRPGKAGAVRPKIAGVDGHGAPRARRRSRRSSGAGRSVERVPAARHRRLGDVLRRRCDRESPGRLYVGVAAPGTSHEGDPLADVPGAARRGDRRHTTRRLPRTRRPTRT